MHAGIRPVRAVRGRERRRDTGRREGRRGAGRGEGRWERGRGRRRRRAGAPGGGGHPGRLRRCARLPRRGGRLRGGVRTSEPAVPRQVSEPGMSHWLHQDRAVVPRGLCDRMHGMRDDGRVQCAVGVCGCRGGTVSGPSLRRARVIALALGGAALGLACGTSSGGSAAKLGAGAACSCAGDDAAAGTDTLCGGPMYTACDSSLSLYCVDGTCATLCDAGKCPAGYVCQDLPHSNQTYCAPAGGDGWLAGHRAHPCTTMSARDRGQATRVTTCWQLPSHADVRERPKSRTSQLEP